MEHGKGRPRDVFDQISGILVSSHTILQADEAQRWTFEWAVQ